MSGSAPSPASLAYLKAAHVKRLREVRGPLLTNLRVLQDQAAFDASIGTAAEEARMALAALDNAIGVLDGQSPGAGGRPGDAASAAG